MIGVAIAAPIIQGHFVSDLVGTFDGALRAAPQALAGFGAVLASEPSRMVTSHAPRTWPRRRLGLRFLAVFAFMQTMHYVVWIAAPVCAGGSGPLR
jgi:hypothetical protein